MGKDEETAVGGFGNAEGGIRRRWREREIWKEAGEEHRREGDWEGSEGGTGRGGDWERGRGESLLKNYEHRTSDVQSRQGVKH